MLRNFTHSNQTIMLRGIIIDDEARARSVLATLIKENVPDIEIVDTADDVPNGVISINKYKPDVVFLDVEMPNYNGFQLLDFFENINFNIVFTTAYSDYALQAFQVSAIDYLLKPIQIEQLLKAVEKLKSHAKTQNNEKFQTLKTNLGEKGVQKLALPVSNGLRFVPLEEIIYLEADGAYTNFMLRDGSKIVVSKKIKEFEDALSPDKKFFRPHRSYIVNLNSIKQYIKSDGGYLIMDNGDNVSLSREMKDAFLEVMGD
jgi:two-component system LytT family response regulator